MAGMYIKNERLTIQWVGNTANITIAFTVWLNEFDQNLTGGFCEQIYLAPSPRGSSDFRYGPIHLWVDDAVETIPGTGDKEVYREHTFQVPRYPQGVFKTVAFNGYINVWPEIQLSDEKATGEGVLPARYTLWPTIQNLVKSFRTVFRP